MRRFVADAGHELRTPLTAVSGFVDVLERGGPDPTAMHARVLPTMKKEAKRMQALVERLIALSRLEGLDQVAPSEVDLGQLVSEAIVELRAVRAGRVALTDVTEVPVYVDATGIYEALLNLIENALKYGEGSDVHVAVAREGDEAVVRVQDGGPGIEEGDRGRIFERFYRGNNRLSIEGSGLGLAIAARAAERAGGSVLLESAEPGRTVFALRLPALRYRSTMR
jgi:two-component system OmpR family sensor kinase